MRYLEFLYKRSYVYKIVIVLLILNLVGIAVVLNRKVASGQRFNAMHRKSRIVLKDRNHLALDESKGK